MTEQIQGRVIISWNLNYMKTPLVLVGFAEVHIYKDLLGILINDNIRPLQHTQRVKIDVFRHHISLPEQTEEGNKEGAPK